MKNKRLLLVQPLYSIVIYTFLSLLCLLCCFLPHLLKWENSKVLLKIIYYFIFTSGTILFLIISILCIEFAFIDDQKIVIKNIFGEIVKVEWNECCSISKERILTYNSRSIIFLNWLIIKTDKAQKASRVRLNRKNVLPILIIASKKNIEAIIFYAPKNILDLD